MPGVATPVHAGGHRQHQQHEELAHDLPNLAAENQPDPVARHIQQLACDSHCQTPWSPTYWNTDLASQQGVVMNTNVMNDNMMNNNRMYANMMTHNMMTNNSGNMMNTDVLTNMMNTNMMNSNVMSYKRGYLNNDGYSCYEDSSP